MRIKIMICFFVIFLFATFAWAELNHGNLNSIDPHAYTATIDGKKYRLANNIRIYKGYRQPYETLTVWDLQEGTIVLFELEKNSSIHDEQITKLIWFVEPQ
ncbi:hypothetical protein [Desulfobotulus mexicanus]|uniref:Uncharacterized protein n=1 Tax=Desulfobotulus mexicanus TaxID=2586642 RepID=A0A5Q4VG13_9BACT|nr:hypothetical protein [Desulfobotulus mexicanus]TYT75080.1 hypothetical protein FIM25_06710 [Desulfobotulus mexicanus]